MVSGFWSIVNERFDAATALAMQRTDDLRERALRSLLTVNVL